MKFYALRLTCLSAAAALLAACGGPSPEPVPAPEPIAEEPAAVEEAETGTTQAHEDGADDHDPDEETAGGTAHVHGLADLALSREGNRYEAELISPLANFGLSEADGAFTDVVTAELSGLIELVGGDCTASVPEAEVDTSSGHADGHIHASWTCANPGGVTALRFAGFTAFPSFETVSAVYLTDTGQKVGELTPSAPELSLK